MRLLKDREFKFQAIILIAFTEKPRQSSERGNNVYLVCSSTSLISNVAGVPLSDVRWERCSVSA